MISLVSTVCCYSNAVNSELPSAQGEFEYSLLSSVCDIHFKYLNNQDDLEKTNTPTFVKGYFSDVDLVRGIKLNKALLSRFVGQRTCLIVVVVTNLFGILLS